MLKISTGLMNSIMNSLVPAQTEGVVSEIKIGDRSKMSESQKKIMAIQAAASYSTSLPDAVIEYCRLIGLEHSQELHDELQNEMLGLLPKYRHPLDVITEYMIFFGRLDCKGVAYNVPPFLKRLQEEEVVNTDLYNAIEEYTKEAERDKLELAQCKHKKQKLEALLDNAKKIYHENDGRADRRNTLVVQALGFSTGTPQKRIDYEQVYKDYYFCVRKSGKSGEDALAQIQKEHELNSRDTTIKALYKAREGVFEAWEQLCGGSSPKIKEFLKGFIPSRR